MLDGYSVGIRSEDFVPLLEHVYKVAARAAAGVEHANARRDSSAQDLVEEVDVDVAELIGERHGRSDCAPRQISPIRSAAGIGFAIAADWPAQTCMR